MNKNAISEKIAQREMPGSALHSDSAQGTYLASEAETLYVEAQGTRYAYRSFGKDLAPPLIFLMRFRGTMDDWDPALLEIIAKERRVILFDSAGIGRSTGETPTTVAGMALASIEFINALELEQVDLFGWSLGGFVALQAGLDRPDIVRKLIIAGSGPGYVPNAPRLPQKVGEVANKTRLDDDDFLYLFFAESQSSQASGVEHLGRLRLRSDAFAALVQPAAIAAQNRAIHALNTPEGSLLPHLSHLEKPVLIANGKSDIMVPAYDSFVGAQTLPDAKLIIYPNSGHGFLFQYADDFGRETLNFLTA